MMENGQALVVPKEKIDQKTVEEFLFSTGTKLDDQQKKLFFALSVRNQLDPFKREIYAIPYENKETGKKELSVVTGYEVYLKRAERSGKLNGWKCWTEGSAAKGDLRAIIEIERKDWSKPLKHEVMFSEYDLHRSLWKTKPVTMIKKVAIAQGFRLAFPEELGGIPYTADEIDTHEVIDITPEKSEPQTQSAGGDKNEGEKPPAEGSDKTKTKDFDFLKSMGKAKSKVGEQKYYEILSVKFGYKHSNEVTDPQEQQNILQDLREAYKDGKSTTQS